MAGIVCYIYIFHPAKEWLYVNARTNTGVGHLFDSVKISFSCYWFRSGSPTAHWSYDPNPTLTL